MRVVVPLILLVLVAIALGLWLLRALEVDSLEHLPAFTALTGPLSPIPGQEERRFPAELEDKLESAITAQLQRLGEALSHPDRRDTAGLAPLLATGFEGSSLRPDDLAVVRAGAAVTVSRAAGAARGGSYRGAAGFADAVAALLRPFGSAERIRVDLELIRVAREGAQIATEIDFEASGRAAVGSTQQNATWHARFTPPAGDEPPLLSGLRADDFEEIVGPADGSALFSDFTSSVLGRDRAFLEQLVPGRDLWGSALDVGLGDQTLGSQGLAIGDVNGDGLDDVFVAQGGGLPDRLFIQELDGTARDMAGAAGVDYLDGTTSALLLDLDNDGDQDLVTASGPILLHSNDGSGRFTLETTVPTSTVYSMTAADYDADGDLDLYACKYGSPEKIPPKNGLPDLMLRNDSHWQFTDVTREIGLDENNRRYGFAASWVDYDEDGDPDLHVANDFGPDNLYRNDGGKFHDVAASAGVEDMGPGMSSTWGDYNQDGHVDLYVSNMGPAAGSSLFENLGDGKFRDVSSETGVTRGRWARGSKFVDLDNDGLEDIFVVNGYVTLDDTQGLRSVCFLNSGTPRFADISAVSGLDSADDGRGLAVVDWDLDGALDFWVSNRTGPQLRFLRNLKKTAHHFVALRLEGRTCNRDAIGARVELHRKSGPPLVRTLHGGDGYLSQSSKWLHFGLGESTEIDRLVVRWPGGASEEFSGLVADRRFSLVQGSGSAREWPAPRPAAALPEPSEIAQPPAGAVRTYLAVRLPLPGLDFTGEAGDRASVAGDGKHPLLISLWASGCEPCRQELTELRDARDRLARIGLRVLALSVDLEVDRPRAREFLESLGWTFDQGYADRDLLEVLSIIRQSIVDLPGDMAVPTHFLADRQHQLAAVYRGPVALDTLLDDASSLDLDPEKRRDRATPFPGRWVGPAPARRSTATLANRLRGRGHADLASFYLTGLELPNSAAEAGREWQAESFEYLGRSLTVEGRHQEATSAYAKGLEIDPLRSSLHHAMGQSLVELKRLDGAIRHFEHAVRLDPEGAEAHFDLGSAYVQRARIEDGIEEFQLAVELSPPGSVTHYTGLYNLGVAHDVLGQPEKALEFVARALAEEHDFFDAWRFLGHFHQQRKEWPGAIDAYSKALELRPEEPQTLYQLGWIHVQAGDPAAARRQYDVLQRIAPPLAAQLSKAIEAE